MSNETKRPPVRQGGGPGGPQIAMAGAKAKDFKGSIGRLLKYIGKYKIAVIIVVIFAVASTIFSIIGPKLMGNATTVLFEGVMGQIGGTGQGVDFLKISQILITLVILYGISALFGYIQGYITVSYTHLDVYKRQVYRQSRPRSACRYTAASNIRIQPPKAPLRPPSA